MEKEIRKVIEILAEDLSFYTLSINDIVVEILEGLGFVSEYVFETYNALPTSKEVVDLTYRELGRFLMER